MGYLYQLLSGPLGFITNIRGSQLVIIVLVILLLFGAKRLPEIARGFGKAIREFKGAISGVEDEFRNAMNEKKPDPQKNKKEETAQAECKND